MQSKRLSNNVDFKGVYLIKEADVSYPAFGVTSKLWRPGAAYARTGSPWGRGQSCHVHRMRCGVSQCYLNAMVSETVTPTYPTWRKLQSIVMLNQSKQSCAISQSKQWCAINTSNDAQQVNPNNHAQSIQAMMRNQPIQTIVMRNQSKQWCAISQSKQWCAINPSNDAQPANPNPNNHAQSFRAMMRNQPIQTIMRNRSKQ